MFKKCFSGLERSLVASLVLLLFSTVVSAVVAEQIASKLLQRLEEKASCPSMDVNSFNKSRIFSQMNAFYEPLTSVAHCSKEFNYIYNIDRYGYRQSSSVRKDPVLLAVGDSFTFGFGVNDHLSFPSLLGAHNAGMYAMSFDTQFSALKRGLRLVEPKIVIWGIYAPHIITMMDGNWSHYAPGDKILFSIRFKLLQDFFDLLDLEGFSKFSIVKLLYRAFNIKAIVREGSEVVIYMDPYYTKELILFDENIHNTKYTSFDEVNSKFAYERDRVLHEMSEIFKSAKSISAASDAEILFVLIPSKLNLHFLNGTRRFPKYPNFTPAAELPNKLVYDSILKAGFSADSILDLSISPELRSMDWSKYYFTDDAHMNEAGNYFVARAIGQRLALEPHTKNKLGQ